MIKDEGETRGSVNPSTSVELGMQMRKDASKAKASVNAGIPKKLDAQNTQVASKIEGSLNAGAPVELDGQNTPWSSTVAWLRGIFGLQNAPAEIEDPTEQTSLLAVPQTLYAPPQYCERANPSQGAVRESLPRYG